MLQFPTGEIFILPVCIVLFSYFVAAEAEDENEIMIEEDLPETGKSIMHQIRVVIGERGRRFLAL